MSDTNMPKISIITCSYQQGDYLDATMRSVLDQEYPELEYIVIDGASRDNSVEVIRQYEQSLAYWVSERDAGQSEALIKGFARSTGDIQGWLCSDDLLLPGALKKVAAFFAQNPTIDAVYGDSLWIDADGSYIRAKKEMAFNRFVYLFDHNYIPQPSMFWRRRLYDAVGGLNTRFNLAMDSDLWERFSQRTHIAHIPDYLSCMRYYPEQKTRAMRPQGAIEDAEIRSRSSLAALPAVQPLLRGAARGVRGVQKLLAGGYGARPDATLLGGLHAYRIEARGN